MILISHRGNINGRIPYLENTLDYIDIAIDSNFDVEIDIWLKDDMLYLGHDKPETRVEYEWLDSRKDWLWLHCKNFDALSYLLGSAPGFKLFYHEQEKYTIISNGNIWAHDLSNVDDKCIIPLLSKEDVEKWEVCNVYGVCSDYIELLT